MRALPQRYTPNAAPQDANQATRAFINDELRRLSTMIAQLDEIFVTHEELDTALDDYALKAGNETITGDWIFTPPSGEIRISGTDTLLSLHDTNAATDEKIYWLRNSAGQFLIQSRTDAGAAGANALIIDRTGTGIDSVFLPSDNEKLFFGAGNDFAIYHDGTNTRLDNITGRVYVNQTVNAGHKWTMENPSTGSGAFTQLDLGNGTENLTLYTLGTNYTTSGKYIAHHAVIEHAKTLTLSTTGADPINFYTTNTLRAYFDAAGSFNMGAPPSALLGRPVGDMVQASATQPNFWMYEADAGTDEKIWRQVASGGDWFLQTSKDDISTTTTALRLTRNGDAITQFLVNCAGSVSAPAVAISSGTIGFYVNSGTLNATVDGSTNIFQMLSTGEVEAKASSSLVGYCFQGDTDTGLGWAAADSARLFSGGNVRIAWNATGIGFNGATPIARPDYTVTNTTTDRSISANGTGETLATLSSCLGTLIQRLISSGLLP